MDSTEINKQIQEIENAMEGADFWTDKIKAQTAVKELAELKMKKEGVAVFDRGNAIMSIISGAGGDDAEDFSRMLFEMYAKYFLKKKFTYKILHEHKNDQGGYRNLTMEIEGPSFAKALAGKEGVYGTFKHESGVHRLVRVSPFNSKGKRNTSFSLVEVIPKIPKTAMPELNEGDMHVEFARAGGPGGQNVNKRETAVRATHIPTGITVHVREERSQEQNRERAMEIIRGKLFRKAEEEHKTLAESLKISKTTEIEWGNQIRNYVLHPYKMVKDLRTGVETSDVKGVLEDGELDAFIEAEKGL